MKKFITINRDIVLVDDIMRISYPKLILDKKFGWVVVISWKVRNNPHSGLRYYVGDELKRKTTIKKFLNFRWKSTKILEDSWKNTVKGKKALAEYERICNELGV